jgi:hypothetical protein
MIHPEAVSGFRPTPAPACGDRGKRGLRRNRVYALRPARGRYRHGVAARRRRIARAVGYLRQLRDAALSACRAKGVFRPLSGRSDARSEMRSRFLISLMDAQVGRDVTYDGRIFVVHGSFSRFSRYEATEPDLGLI